MMRSVVEVPRVPVVLTPQLESDPALISASEYPTAKDQKVMCKIPAVHDPRVSFLTILIFHPERQSGLRGEWSTTEYVLTRLSGADTAIKCPLFFRHILHLANDALAEQRYLRKPGTKTIRHEPMQ